MVSTAQLHPLPVTIRAMRLPSLRSPSTTSLAHYPSLLPVPLFLTTPSPNTGLPLLPQLPRPAPPLARPAILLRHRPPVRLTDHVAAPPARQHENARALRATGPGPQRAAGRHENRERAEAKYFAGY
jgi:hypothetical protein